MNAQRARRETLVTSHAVAAQASIWEGRRLGQEGEMQSACKLVNEAFRRTTALSIISYATQVGRDPELPSRHIHTRPRRDPAEDPQSS